MGDDDDDGGDDRPLQRTVPLRQSVYEASLTLIRRGAAAGPAHGRDRPRTPVAQRGKTNSEARTAGEAEGWVDLRPSQALRARTDLPEVDDACSTSAP